MAIGNVTTSPFPTMQPGDHLGPQFDGIDSPGLTETQQTSNAQVPRTVAPSSSGNGMSAGQFDATLGGAFPNSNGMAPNQYQVAKFTMGKNS
jgi:hypothetical protein